MKMKIRQFLELIFRFYPYSFFERYRHWKNLCYTSWILHAFKEVGKNPYICSPLYIKGGENIIVGDNFTTFRGLRIETYSMHNGVKYSPYLKIGDNVSINFDCHIGCIDKIEIGNNVLLASRVFITDHFHGLTNTRDDLKIPPSQRFLSTKGSIVIEDDVWIGEGAVVMPGVRIGKGAIIGANAVVTKDIQPYTIVAGVPARVVKQL